ncbi:alpha/beta hydrolase [uncultured Paraglaciecola sp.]|uniref:alpha/beta fold hydrolase n=1 Tax=uncultured Paraglaciecola sp. TaxID=1765024 RepID=UPI00260D4DB1|nr:alpha/beta hydrolase [uncultured Paraglaciecola sp.]
MFKIERHISILLFFGGFLGLFAGCEQAKFDDEVSKDYSLDNSHSKYHQLVTRPAKELSNVELYNRLLTLWDTPYRELELPTSTGSAHVIVSGPVDGDALVLLHGMNVDSTMWYPNIKALSKHFRVYAIDDILGPGKSTLNTSDDSIEFLVSWYFEVFDLLELEKPSIIGASQGGWIATNLAISHPNKFNHLVLLSPAQTFTWLDPSIDLLSSLIFTLNPEREGLDEYLSTLSNHVESIESMYIDHFLRTSKSGSISPLLLDMKPFDNEKLSNLPMPVLLLIGDNDLFNGQDSINRANQALPCIQTNIIKDSGHFINVDQAEIVNRQITEFVALNRAC